MPVWERGPRCGGGGGRGQSRSHRFERAPLLAAARRSLPILRRISLRLRSRSNGGFGGSSRHACSLLVSLHSPHGSSMSHFSLYRLHGPQEYVLRGRRGFPVLGSMLGFRGGSCSDSLVECGPGERFVFWLCLSPGWGGLRPGDGPEEEELTSSIGDSQMGGTAVG